MNDYPSVGQGHLQDVPSDQSIFTTAPLANLLQIAVLP